MRWPICTLVQIALCGVATHALREVRITMPEAVLSGSEVVLTCDYNLEEAMLYSIKWYRGDQEFYRYVPKESPPTRVFALQGIHVDLSKSNSRDVTLLDVQSRLTGLYKCEVSADAPLFHTIIKSALLTVVDPPADEPQIEAEKRRFARGELVRANCTSSASYPAANISWFINGVRVVFPMTVSAAEGDLERTSSQLEVEVGPSSFPDGRMRVRCVAALYSVYQRSSEILHFTEESPQIASVRELGLSGGGATWVPHHVILLASIVLLLANR